MHNTAISNTISSVTWFETNPLQITLSTVDQLPCVTPSSVNHPLVNHWWGPNCPLLPILSACRYLHRAPAPNWNILSSLWLFTDRLVTLQFTWIALHVSSGTRVPRIDDAIAPSRLGARRGEDYGFNPTLQLLQRELLE